MATYKNFDHFMRSLTGVVQKKVAKVVAETATEYYKDRFRTKEWDGQPWPATKRVVKRGTLLLRSSALANSIRPSLVTSERVRISAGNSKVPYAKVHNEGGILHPTVTPKMRKWAWANYYKVAGKGTKTIKKTGVTYTSWNKEKSDNVNFYKAIALTKKSKLDITIQKRQYMGHSPKLNQLILTRIQKLLNSL